MNPIDTAGLQIIDYQEQYATDFKNISLEWFTSAFFLKHFSADAYDHKVISNPSKYIIAKGGHIFFAKLDDRIVGTTALVSREDNSFELSKMGVLEKYRGLNISDQLINAAIDFSKAAGKKTLWLESIKILKPALALFKKHGFEQAPAGQAFHYARADIKMGMNLN